MQPPSTPNDPSARRDEGAGHASPPMITVDGAMEAMARHYFDYHQHPIGHKGNALYDALHKALTAAATNNTNDNG
jgi:hypothetical protein